MHSFQPHNDADDLQAFGSNWTCTVKSSGISAGLGAVPGSWDCVFLGGTHALLWKASRLGLRPCPTTWQAKLHKIFQARVLQCPAVPEGCRLLHGCCPSLFSTARTGREPPAGACMWGALTCTLTARSYRCNKKSLLLVGSIQQPNSAATKLILWIHCPQGDKRL